MTEYPGYEMHKFETTGGYCCTGNCTFCYVITEEDVKRMSNSSRQPKTEKAVGNPNKGRPASTITQADTTPNRLQGKEVEPGPSDES